MAQSFEPRYVSNVDETDDIDPVDNPRSMAGFTPAFFPIVNRALMACGRKYFATKAEKKTWVRIQNNVEAQKLNSAWVIENIGLAEENNQFGVTRSFSWLTKRVTNMATYTDWNVRDAKKVKNIDDVSKYLPIKERTDLNMDESAYMPIVAKDDEDDILPE